MSPTHTSLPCRFTPPPRAAFTLVELLVVLAVVALLAGLLLPALARARQRARSTACLNHTLQLGVAFHLYADDHGGLLPADPPFQQPNLWIGLIDPYIGGQRQVLQCSADLFGAARRAAGRSSYVLNQYTASGSDGNEPYPVFGPNGELIPAHEFSQRLDTYPNPSATFLLFEVGNLGNVGPAALWHDDHTHPVTWGFGWQHVLADVDPERHGATANSLYADGHAAAVRSDTLRTRIEAGDNFSLIAR